MQEPQADSSFICPQCLREFSTIEESNKHYYAFHINNSDEHDEVHSLIYGSFSKCSFMSSVGSFPTMFMEPPYENHFPSRICL